VEEHALMNLAKPPIIGVQEIMGGAFFGRSSVRVSVETTSTDTITTASVAASNTAGGAFSSDETTSAISLNQQQWAQIK
jgi:hypothetical protein